MNLTHEAKKELKVVSSVFNQQDWPETDKRELIAKVKKILKRDGTLNYKAFEPKARWDFCAERLKQGDYRNWDGWEFRSDWSMTFRWGVEMKCPLPKWDMEPVNHLVVLGEQGIGDEIMFLSALPEIIARYGRDCIEFQAYPRIQSIVERSFGIRCTDRRLLSDVVTGDAVMALGELFPWYRRDKTHFPKKPYLKADPEKVEHWRKYLEQFGTKPKVGVAWASSKGTIDPKSLKTIDGVYFDLQYRDGKAVSDESTDWLEKPPFDVTSDFENLFAFVKALDRVHSITQTLCHVAGSQGVETKAVIPETKLKMGLWYYFNGSNLGSWESPIYPNFTVYRNIEEFRKNEC
jgi:hypothetical protein